MTDPRLHPDLAAWLARVLGPPTPAQAQAVPLVLDGRSVLVSSPTGSGKTLAAFLGLLSDLAARDDAGALEERVHVVYVSPLKALARDVAANLLAPLQAIGRHERIRVALRTGDTPPAERERMARRPPHVLVTTPESLALVLGSARLAPALAGCRAVVVDEVHALLGTKRGAHLALSLERLEEAAGAPLQRVGLSATVRPLEEAARFLCGTRPCAVVEAPPRRPPSLLVGRATDAELVGRIGAVVAAHRTTLVFTNTRANAERLAARLGDRMDEREEGDLVAPHHGSMSRESRLLVEDKLRRSELRCVVASSSLELGIHVDDVDAVVLAGSPRSAARAVQRVGRSGHRVGGEPKGILLAEDADELAEAVALAGLVAQGFLEPTRVPAGGLDVLAQHLLGLALRAPVDVDDAWRLARRAWPYRDLAREDVDALVDHLEDARLVTRDGRAYAARGRLASWSYATSAGAIPDAALLRVTSEGRYVGEVEEAFAETLEPGDVFQLAGRSWRLLRVVGRSVEATPARVRDRGEVPAWRSEGIAASPELAAATRTAEAFLENVGYDSPATKERVSALLAAQRAFAGPEAPGECLVELGLTPSGGRALVLHAPLGRRATDALARALAARCREPATPVASDLGLALVGRRGWRPAPATVRAWLDAPLRGALEADLADGELLRRRFRHVGERAFLLPRRDGTLRDRQREATRALRALQRDRPDHPLLREAWREALEDALDLPAAEAWRQDVVEGRIALRFLAARPCLSPWGAAIATPRGGPTRAEALRDAVDAALAWTENERRAPRARGG